MAPDRRRALGSLGERIACEHLRAAGYLVVDRNFRTRHGELDVVAADPDHLVFCEVKTRVAGRGRGPAAPLDAIGPTKRRRLRIMAMEWLRVRAGDPMRPCRARLRFDAIGVLVDARGALVALEHVEGAF